MTEGLYEIDKNTYNKLSNDEFLLRNFGYMVACNSMFKPFEYGYFGSTLNYDFTQDRYYLRWKRGDQIIG